MKKGNDDDDDFQDMYAKDEISNGKLEGRVMFCTLLVKLVYPTGIYRVMRTPPLRSCESERMI